MKPFIIPLVALLALAATPALAQIQAGPSLKPGGASGGPGAGPEDGKKPVLPPPALPGAASKADRAIKADKPLSEMSPTDALFDSVDRGNLADAKDAVSRGADLGAHNALGQTALEASVDLGHNDLTFYLLSLRGLDDHARRAPPPRRAAAADKPARTRRATAAAPATDAPAPPPAPARYVQSDGGRPVPQAGFLGFGH